MAITKEHEITANTKTWDTDDFIKNAFLEANRLGLRQEEVVEVRIKREFAKGVTFIFTTKNIGR